MAYFAIIAKKCFAHFKMKRFVVGYIYQSTIDSEGFKGALKVPPLCRETQSLGQQMLKEPLGINCLITIDDITLWRIYISIYLY